MKIQTEKDIFNERKEEISQYATDNQQAVYFPDGYENGLIGWTDDGEIHAVYDYDKSIEYWARTNNTSIEDSIDNFEYNCVRSLPYLKEGRPIFIHTFQ